MTSLQLELFYAALDEIDGDSVVQRLVLISNELDDLLCGNAANKGGSRGRRQEPAANPTVRHTSWCHLHFCDGVGKSVWELTTNVHSGDSLLGEALYLGDVRGRDDTGFRTWPSSEFLVVLLRGKHCKQETAADGSLSIVCEVLCC